MRDYLTKKSASDVLPVLSDYDVYLKMKKAKKSASSLGGDIPTKILKLFSVELSNPISKIFNLITKNQEYPSHWKKEHGIALAKIKPP